ncbi:MAG TPA: hypothetical protein VHE30_18815 [Polyangiaceae bacterium]|nr:hypothetical protein [Polyangiaceae bacterium]
MARIRAVSDRRSELVSTFELLQTAPKAVASPDAADALSGWMPATAPGTVASALRDAGRFRFETCPDLDATDVWYRARLPAVPRGDGPVFLVFGGLATFADVYLNGEALLSSRSMFTEEEVDVTSRLREENVLHVHFRATSTELAVRRPRPRWKTRLVSEQQLRFHRTTLLGRIPGWCPRVAPVGPYRPISLERRSRVASVAAELRSELSGTEGSVSGTIRLATANGRSITRATLSVGETSAALDVRADGDGRHELSGAVRMPGVDLWWPHTHGAQPLFFVSLTLVVDGEEVRVDLGRTGFRGVERIAGDGFGLAVNGVPVFCRGACWTPLDVVSLSATESEYRKALGLAKAAGMNMIRVGGTMFYEDDLFHAVADELGILVFQDFMFANMDYPVADADFASLATREARELSSRLALSPSIATFCGGSEVEQQAAMMGIARDQWTSPLFSELLPAALAAEHPGVPYVPSTPTGGALPFHTDSGISHYFGVGAYLRPLEDARRANVKFAAECLAFANVPSDETIEAFLADGEAPPHHPRWKARVPRDSGPGWDFDDVRDHYVKELFRVDPAAVRYADVARYLELGRVAVGEVMSGTFGEFRRAGSSCNGALVWFYRDLWPGAGWGVVDALGRPKSVYYYLARALAPVALFASDEGANGVELALVNDRPTPAEGVLEVLLLRDGATQVARESAPVVVPARGGITVRADALFSHFLDTAYAYRFGPPGYHALSATLRDAAGNALAETLFLPRGLSDGREELGLESSAEAEPDGSVLVTLTAKRLALAVSVEARGFVAEDSYFPVLPGVARTTRLRPHAAAPDGRAPPPRLDANATALNGSSPCRIRLT